ncbi:MAG: hypothetical protein ACREQ9_26360 [Candidatus Binatia bacterium]
MKALFAVGALAGFLALLPAAVSAQCCQAACVDADGQGVENDLARCGDPAPNMPGAESLPGISGCTDAAPAGCIGGTTRDPGLEPLRSPVAGCLCVAGACVAGDPDTGDILVGDPAAAVCARSAAYFCNQAGNVVVESANDPSCTAQ